MVMQQGRSSSSAPSARSSIPRGRPIPAPFSRPASIRSDGKGRHLASVPARAADIPIQAESLMSKKPSSPSSLLQRGRDHQYEATRPQVRRQVAAGNNIMCAGTNGDFTALTHEERSGSPRRWSTRSAVASMSSSMPACPRPSRRCSSRAASTHRRQRHRRHQPFFIACTQDGLIRHFSTVADA